MQAPTATKEPIHELSCFVTGRGESQPSKKGNAGAVHPRMFPVENAVSDTAKDLNVLLTENFSVVQEVRNFHQ